MRVKSLVLVGILGLALAVLVAYAIGYEQDSSARDQSSVVAQRVLAKVHAGMTRTQVEQEINGDSGKHYRCGTADAYLIGNVDPNRASILYFAYRSEPDGTQVLERIGGLDKDMLPSFQSCPSSSP